ncbi:MAG TPA: MAPEG family protein, partial [Micropepsaceae bacterium]|nr:MAPEG family protein [Micropepsaceae bacterium]
MSIELWLLAASIVLGFIHIFAQGQSMTVQRGLRYNAGPRDEPMPPLTGVAGRLERALRNFLESFAFFAAAVLMAQTTNIHNGLTVWGAWLYVAGRVAYLPLYGFGVPYIRSLAWNVATVGILLVLGGVVYTAALR